MKAYCPLLLCLLTIVTSPRVDATAIKVRPRHHLPSHHTDLEILEKHQQQNNEHLSESDTQGTLSKNSETKEEQTNNEEVDLDVVTTKSQKTEQPDVQLNEEQVNSLDEQHDSGKLMVTEENVSPKPQNEQTNQTPPVIKMFENENVEYQNVTSADVQDKSNNKIQKEDDLVVLEQEKIVVTGEQEQTNDTVTEEPEQTSDKVTEKQEQTNDTVTEEPEQISDKVTEKQEQTNDTVTEEPEQTSDKVTEKQEQTNDTVTEEPEQANDMVTEKQEQTNDTVTEEPEQKTNQIDILEEKAEQVGNTEHSGENNSEKENNVISEDTLEPEVEEERHEVQQNVSESNTEKPEPEESLATQQEENQEGYEDLERTNTKSSEKEVGPETSEENQKVLQDLKKDNSLQLPEKGHSFEKDNNENFKERETENQENKNSHDPEEVTKEDLKNSSNVENKPLSDQLEVKSQSDNDEKPKVKEDHTETDIIDENDEEREPEEQIKEHVVKNLTGHESGSSVQQMEVNFEENIEDSLGNDKDSNTEKKQNQVDQGLKNDTESASSVEQEQLVLKESSTKENLDTKNKENHETEEESFLDKESNKDVTEEETEFHGHLEEVHGDNILEDEVYPILPGTIHLFEKQLPELNLALTEHLRGDIFRLGDKMKTGIEELGIPVLDPLPLPDRDIFPVIGGEVFDTHFREIAIKGLSNFGIQEIDANLRSLRVRLTIHFPQVYADCSFKANGTLFDVFTVTGNGQMLVEFNDIIARTMIYLKREDGKVRVHIADHPYVEFSVARVKLLKTRENRQLGYSGLSGQLAPILFWIFTEDIVEEIDYYLAKYIDFSLDKFGFPDYFFDLPPYQRHLRIALTKPIPYNFISPYFSLAYGLNKYRI